MVILNQTDVRMVRDEDVLQTVTPHKGIGVCVTIRDIGEYASVVCIEVR